MALEGVCPDKVKPVLPAEAFDDRREKAGGHVPAGNQESVIKRHNSGGGPMGMIDPGGSRAPVLKNGPGHGVTGLIRSEELLDAWVEFGIDRIHHAQTRAGGGMGASGTGVLSSQFWEFMASSLFRPLGARS